MSILDEGKTPEQLERQEQIRRMDEAVQAHLFFLQMSGQFPQGESRGGRVSPHCRKNGDLPPQEGFQKRFR